MFYGLREGQQGTLESALHALRGIFQKVHAVDNMILINRALAYRHDKRFMEAIRRHAHDAQERSLLLRLHTLVWAALNALNVPGDFVECGVYRGFSSAVVTDYLDFAALPRQFYLYDTFAGIPPQYDSEQHDDAAYHAEGLYESVVQRFAAYPNVRILRGAVPDSFAQGVPETIAFLHLDMNSSVAEIAALEALLDRVSPGGLIVFDDYGWLGYEAQQYAEERFMKKRGHHILELPTGQGLVIKY
jgi:hypothetical protein